MSAAANRTPRPPRREELLAPDPCIAFIRGDCPLGDQCVFGHTVHPALAQRSPAASTSTVSTGTSARNSGATSQPKTPQNVKNKGKQKAKQPQPQQKQKQKQTNIPEHPAHSEAEARELEALRRVEELINPHRKATSAAAQPQQRQANSNRSSQTPTEHQQRQANGNRASQTPAERKRQQLAQKLKKAEEDSKAWIARELAERNLREENERRAEDERRAEEEVQRHARAEIVRRAREEAERLEREEAERLERERVAREAREAEQKRIAAEAQALAARQRAEREAEARRLKAEANRQRREQAKEAEKKRKEANAAKERERLLRIAEAERKAKEAEERRRLAKEAEDRRREAQLAREREERQRREEALAREREVEERRRQELLVQRHREYADATWAHLGLRSTIVTFAAGLEIQKVVPGFETCRARLTNLPTNIKQGRDVAQLLEVNGIPRGTFHVISIFRKEANILIASSEQNTLHAVLDDVEISDDADVDGMGAANRSTIQITLSYLFSSVSYVFTYPTVDEAQAARKRLDRHVFGDRTLSARTNNLRGVPDMNGVIVSGFVSNVSNYEIVDLAEGATLKRLNPLIFDEEFAAERLQAILQLRDAASFNTFNEGPFTKIRAQFRDLSAARKVYDDLNGVKQPWIGNKDVRVTLPTAFRYTLTIPVEQYRAQRQTWNDFPKYRRNSPAAGVEIQEQQDRVFIRVIGDDAKDVGQLKVRIESVARGKKIEDWTRPYISANFLRTVRDGSGAYVRWDYRMGEMKVYGNAQAMARAAEIFKEEIERLAAQEISVFLKRESVPFFMQRGLQALKDMYEEDNVRLVFSGGACRVVVQGGGHDAKHAVGRLIDESLDKVTAVDAPRAEDDVVCPICFVEVTTPVQVANCGHSYCHNCARHCLATAAETKHFPLLCVGNEGQCRTPIPIPIIQQFLIPQAFNELLEVAFVQYIERHQQEYRYCSTADCVQIYRCDPEATEAIKCPSCLTLTCPACHEAGHDGQRCGHIIAEEQRLTDEFADSQGYQRCPSCNVLVEKTEGCNHVTCRCGTHICWICLGVFDAATIYNHMGQAHGGIHNGIPEAFRRAAPVPTPGPATPTPNVRPVAEAFAHPLNYLEEENYAEQVAALGMFNRQQEAQRRMREANAAAREEIERRARVQLRLRQAQEAEQRDRERVHTQWTNNYEEMRLREERERRQREERERREREGGWCMIM